MHDSWTDSYGRFINRSYHCDYWLAGPFVASGIMGILLVKSVQSYAIPFSQTNENFRHV
jgi:hypothetical protein